MAIREWWANDSEQRFWMEATDRPDLGQDLRAPMSGGEGQEVWHYSLVSFTKPGDIVFHWHTRLFDRPALVGWSEVIGPLRQEDYQWAAHAGSNRGVVEGSRPNWMMPLGGIHFLDRPISIGDFEDIRDEVLLVRLEIERDHGKPTYFPFNGYGRDNIRAAQAYFTKFPRGLVDLLDSRFGLELTLGRAESVEDAIPPGETRRAGHGQGFIRNTELKLAIERHAVSRAVAMYETMGASDIEILGKPYDLRMRLESEEVHVEVKGSGNAAESVLVTRNEVSHARDFARTELVVVDSIEWTTNDAGVIVTGGGRLRRWLSWSPSDESLSAMTYSHELGEGWQSESSPS